MASVTSLMNSSSTSSIYGSRNVLSGLYSGMDTEAMIENAVAGIKKKIQGLYQKRTKVEWQQEAYRSIIDKAVNFNTKYTSYSSKTNLMSSSFFANAVNTATLGTYKDKVAATGKSSSEIKINSVKQMATAASYTVSGAAIGLGKNLASAEEGKAPGIRSELFGLSKQLDVSTASGTMTFKYGGANGASFDISFDELEDWSQYEGDTDTEKLANAIRSKLSDVTYSYTKNGFQETTTADKAIKVEVDSFGITFSDGLGNGNKVSVSAVSDSIKASWGVSKDATGISNKLVEGNGLSKKVAAYEYLAGEQKDGKWTGGKELSVNLNGATKKISMSDVMNNVDLTYDYDGGKSKEEQFADALQGELDKAFGKSKVNVKWDPSAEGEGGNLSLIPAKEGDTLSVSGSAVKSMGFENRNSNYINASGKLSDLLGEDIFTDRNRIAAVGDVKLNSNGKYSVDEKGNRVSKGDDGKYYRVNSDGEFLYNFDINGASINVTKDTTLESLMNSINSNAEAGVKVSYSKLTNEFKFTATETGANSKVEFGGLAKEMFEPSVDAVIDDNFANNFGFYLSDGEKDEVTVSFGGINLSFEVDNTMTMQDFANEINEASGGILNASYNEKTGQFSVTDSYGKDRQFTIRDQYGFDYEREIQPVVTSSYTAGQDAVMDVEVNGKRFENFTRSSNTFDIDGLNITVKGAFEAVGKDGEEYEPITFNTTTDADKIVDAIRSFVDDYNEMATELKNAYSTLPNQKTDGSRYDPLTSDDEDGMTESEIAAYNEKAKQGILFGDTTLSSFYSKLLSAIAPGGTDGQTLREIGIGTSYSDGMTTLSLDEDKLRAALESDPDKVKNAFTKTREGGSSSDGLMQNLQNTLNTYVKTTGEPKGVLIQRAGSVKAYTSLTNNSLYSQIANIDKQIERWQGKMSDQIDYYNTKFTRLETLMAQMDSQYSAMSGLMGGTSGGY